MVAACILSFHRFKYSCWCMPAAPGACSQSHMQTDTSVGLYCTLCNDIHRHSCTCRWGTIYACCMIAWFCNCLWKQFWSLFFFACGCGLCVYKGGTMCYHISHQDMTWCVYLVCSSQEHTCICVCCHDVFQEAPTVVWIVLIFKYNLVKNTFVSSILGESSHQEKVCIVELRKI